jgi:hypothetical protein
MNNVIMPSPEKIRHWFARPQRQQELRYEDVALDLLLDDCGISPNIGEMPISDLTAVVLEQARYRKQKREELKP